MIYFDNAATTFPKPRAVINAVTDAMKVCGNSGRSGHKYALCAAETVYNCRKKLAELFNTRPECVILTNSATTALNMAIKGTNCINGVTVVSSIEHNSVMRPLNSLRKNGDTVLKQFLADMGDDDITCENFSAVSRSATNIVVNHASNVCGRILPIKMLKKLSPGDAVFIADCSQTAGHIPIDIVELGVDIICIPGHKGLLGPMGVGALIINPFSDLVIDPILEGGTGTDSKMLEMPEYYPERLEAGTANIGGIAGLSAALELVEFSSKESELYEYLVNQMKNIVDITIYGLPEKSALSSYVPVLLFNKNGYDCEAVAATLSERGIAVRAGFHCAPNAHRTLGTYEIGGVRVSLSKFNTRREIDRFIDALNTV
ncbi:MAG: aminotransferase class V-fold PLP-dependent enzyme [Ruminococcaceae bacterium]|nr:aminotransferase class V-fold PLP-dependent enzyme [Oscillospiraceae bacterium]